MEVGLGPGDIVLDGDPAPPPNKGAQQLPSFWPMYIVVKRSPISAAAEHLLSLQLMDTFHTYDRHQVTLNQTGVSCAKAIPTVFAVRSFGRSSAVCRGVNG